MPLLICSPYSTDGRITADFITQSKSLGGSTPQTPRWGRGAAPKPRSALVFRWDAYTQLLIHL
ncbi:MAG: hypothetical protein EWV75_16755 [Microcystis wesenbergii Mw_QC_S_20081001_S30D]|uniref:Mobile element protein n=1 Tax=Microcystis wesenbergii Mw_QC_S_20081001_S30D TaxID=2486245 RepID=A0A552JE31_9CHRO|nr:MAG: hypothetical protein EWV75_16755 [Microcystis wesenbergii Mw_QC_S_20081001_S30D]TRU96839.1 MAG: hypothetical protein EWV74_18365 [Microcystis wesenbergii Mw_QC_S_20081001_S30]TRV04567.1 MAG: hypothetical protein EWV73_02450 [Microcystis wesenbergii Mw_QC_B_20070930_S4D]TRV11926.1 MAG: hypothetical protein EWV89_14055 [Microcystis wesenbergii Mw_QC_B_20070930_S4]